MTEIVLVAAVARNGVIGADNRLLWRLKNDLKHFRALTLGHPVIMGRKTFDSIGKPLPGRSTIVVSRTFVADHPAVVVARSFDEALALGRAAAADMNVSAIMVAGGGEVYAALIDRADRLEITEVDLAPEGDAHFPPIDGARWKESARQAHKAGPDDEAAHAFVTYIRR